jgi:hypothetical protein
VVFSVALCKSSTGSAYVIRSQAACERLLPLEAARLGGSAPHVIRVSQTGEVPDERATQDEAEPGRNFAAVITVLLDPISLHIHPKPPP